MPAGAARRRRCSCRRCRSCSALANTLELERDHALDRPKTAEEQGADYNPEDALLAAANSERNGADALGPDGKQGAFEALEAQASFDRVLFDGGEFGTGAEVGSDEELDFLGLPGLLDADQVSELLRQRQADQVSGKRRARRPRPCPSRRWTTASRPSCARSSRSSSARGRGAAVSRTGSVHSELRRRCGGPEVALADPDQLDGARRDAAGMVRR